MDVIPRQSDGPAGNRSFVASNLYGRAYRPHKRSFVRQISPNSLNQSCATHLYAMHLHYLSFTHALTRCPGQLARDNLCTLTNSTASAAHF